MLFPSMSRLTSSEAVAFSLREQPVSPGTDTRGYLGKGNHPQPGWQGHPPRLSADPPQGPPPQAPAVPRPKRSPSRAGPGARPATPQRSLQRLRAHIEKSPGELQADGAWAQGHRRAQPSRAHPSAPRTPEERGRRAAPIPDPCPPPRPPPLPLSHFPAGPEAARGGAAAEAGGVRPRRPGPSEDRRRS